MTVGSHDGEVEERAHLSGHFCKRVMSSCQSVLLTGEHQSRQRGEQGEKRFGGACGGVNEVAQRFLGARQGKTERQGHRWAGEAVRVVGEGAFGMGEAVERAHE